MSNNLVAELKEMKKIFILLCCVVFCSPMVADDYNYLNIATTDGTETSLSVSNLKITYSNGMLVATNGDGTQSFTLTDVSKMYFSSTSTGISELGTVSEDGAVTVYTVAGVKLGVFENVDEAQRQLKSGIYLFKSKSKTFKTIVP